MLEIQEILNVKTLYNIKEKITLLYLLGRMFGPKPASLFSEVFYHHTYVIFNKSTKISK